MEPKVDKQRFSEADARDEAADRRDLVADQRDRDAESRADALVLAESVVLRALRRDKEAELRDRAAEQRDHLAERRERLARDNGDRPDPLLQAAAADRARSAADRANSGIERDLAAGDRADLLRTRDRRSGQVESVTDLREASDQRATQS